MKAQTLQEKSREQLERDILFHTDVVLRHTHAILESKRQLNTLVPIACLPPEVLVEIFTHYRDVAISSYVSAAKSSYPFPHARPITHKPYTWLLVTHVCHCWRQAALEFPRLWNVVVLTAKSDRAVELLSRAKETPLSIFSAHFDLPHFLFEVILRSMGRLTSVDLIASQYKIPNMETPGHATNLEKLSLQLFPNYSNRPVPNTEYDLLDYFVECALPRLRTLCLSGVLSVWPTALFKPTITHVELILTMSIHASAAPMVAVLAAMPLLQELHLKNVFADMIEPDWQNRNMSKVALAHLRTLMLSETTFQCADFLRRVSFPLNARLSLVCTGTTHSANFSRLWESLGPRLAGGADGPRACVLRSLLFSEFGPAGLIIAGWTDTHSVGNLSCYYALSSPGPDAALLRPHLHVSVMDRSWRLGGLKLLKLLNDIDSSQVHSLRLYWQLIPSTEDPMIPKDVVQTMFARFTELRELSVGDWARPHLHNILAHRGDRVRTRPSRSYRPPGEFSMPKLSLLELDNLTLGARKGESTEEAPFSGLKTALSERKEANMGLNTLVIRQAWNFNREDADALKEVVGTVDWDGLVVYELDPEADSSDADTDKTDSEVYNDD